MDNRYYKLIQYKAALDREYKKHTATGIYHTDYDKTHDSNGEAI